MRICLSPLDAYANTKISFILLPLYVKEAHCTGQPVQKVFFPLKKKKVSWRPFLSNTQSESGLPFFPITAQHCTPLEGCLWVYFSGPLRADAGVISNLSLFTSNAARSHHQPAAEAHRCTALVHLLARAQRPHPEGQPRRARHLHSRLCCRVASKGGSDLHPHQQSARVGFPQEQVALSPFAGGNQS